MRCNLCRRPIEDMHIHLLVAHGIKSTFKQVKRKYGQWKDAYNSRLRQMKRTCEACGKSCDGSLETPLIEKEYKLRLCVECFDQELEKAEPILRGNRYYLVPNDAA